MRIISFYKSLPLLCIIFFACNKDENILGDPGDDTGDDPAATTEFTVMEYLPAPGQFINDKASGFENVKSMEAACEYARKRLSAYNYVSLGAYGGYITVKAPKSISNTGGYEFSIAGNAFDSSSEPGIVWVMRDENGNGLPDDTWYELKGSWYGKEGYEKDYSVTYFRPEGNGQDVRWEDNRGASGYVKWNGTFHSQDFYYPEWVRADSYTLTGSRLPARSFQETVTGNWYNESFEWGYADNDGDESEIVNIAGKTVQKNYFRLSDAVDKDGKPASLPGIDFIKVQTAINGTAGVIGENSTEVCGFFEEQ